MLGPKLSSDQLELKSSIKSIGDYVEIFLVSCLAQIYFQAGWSWKIFKADSTWSMEHINGVKAFCGYVGNFIKTYFGLVNMSMKWLNNGPCQALVQYYYHKYCNQNLWKIAVTWFWKSYTNISVVVIPGFLPQNVR